jgi:hypothetical protein
MAGKRTTVAPYIKIAGKPYVVALGPNGRPMYASSTRITQAVPSDDFELPINDFSELGRGFYAGSGFTTVVPGKLYPSPAKTTISATTLSAHMRFWFETGDYLFAIAALNIFKFDISVNPPVLKRVYGSKLGGNGRAYGQPAQMYTARASLGYHWYVPNTDGTGAVHSLDTVGNESSVAYSPAATLNGTIDASAITVVYTGTANTILLDDVIIIDSERMLVVGQSTNSVTVTRAWAATTAASHTTGVAITKATADTWTNVTTLTNNASNFLQMPDGKVWLSTGFYDGAVAENRATVRALVAGSDCEVNASWGSELPVGDQTSAIISLLNYDELLIVGKQDGWYAAQLNTDSTLRWRSLLPDANVRPVIAGVATVPANNPWQRGGV